MENGIYSDQQNCVDNRKLGDIVPNDEFEKVFVEWLLFWGCGDSLNVELFRVKTWVLSGVGAKAVNPGSHLYGAIAGCASHFCRVDTWQSSDWLANSNMWVIRDLLLIWRRNFEGRGSSCVFWEDIWHEISHRYTLHTRQDQRTSCESLELVQVVLVLCYQHSTNLPGSSGLYEVVLIFNKELWPKLYIK